MKEDPNCEELIKSVEKWGVRLLSAVKSFCILNNLNRVDLYQYGFGFFDILLSDKVVLVAFRIPEAPTNPYFQVHWKGNVSTNDLMDFSYNIVKEKDGCLSLCRMFDFSEKIADSLFIAPKEITIVGIGPVERCYSGFLLMQHDIFKMKDPERFAIDFLRKYNVINNLKEASVFLSTKEQAIDVAGELTRIASQFRNLLLKSDIEEDMQVFLKKNPILLYPESVKKWDKLKLGDNFVTDFVFLVNGHTGSEHVFVEIESASKRIFTKSGFSAQYTQAKDQILSWQIWIDQNRRYLSDKIGEIQSPIYHLIMGRNGGMSATDRWKLKKDSSSAGMIFSTYDDILSKYEQNIKAFHRL